MEKYWLWMKEHDIWYSMHMLSINHEQAREDKAPLLAEKPEAWNISKRWRKHQKLINQVDVGVDLEEHDTPWNPQQIKNHQAHAGSISQVDNAKRDTHKKHRHLEELKHLQSEHGRLAGAEANRRARHEPQQKGSERESLREDACPLWTIANLRHRSGLKGCLGSGRRQGS